MPTGGPHAVHFPRPPAEGPAAGSASRIIAALMPAAGGGRRGGVGRRAGGEGGVCPAAGAFPPPLRPATTRRRRSSDPVSVPPPRSSTRPRSPEPAGAPRSSSCRSRSATGFKVGAPVLPAAARPCPAPGPRTRPPTRRHQRAVSPARHLCAPRARPRRREAGAGPGARGRADPRLPGRLFVSSRREGVRLAQSPAGEEAGGDQQGKRTPPPSLVQPRRWGSSRVAGAARPQSPQRPAGCTPVCEAVPAAKSTPFLSFPRAPRSVRPPPLPLCPGLQVGLPPPAPRSSALGISGCKLLLLGWRTRAGPGAPMPAGPGLPRSPPGTSHRDLVLEGTPDVSEQSRFYSLGTEGRPREAWWLP